MLTQILQSVDNCRSAVAVASHHRGVSQCAADSRSDLVLYGDGLNGVGSIGYVATLVSHPPSPVDDGLAIAAASHGVVGVAYSQVGNRSAVVCLVAHVAGSSHAYIIGAGGRFVNNDVGRTSECGNFHIFHCQGDAVSISLTAIVVHHVHTHLVGGVTRGGGYRCCDAVGCCVGCGGCCRQRHTAAPCVGVVSGSGGADGSGYRVVGTAVGADVRCHCCDLHHRSLVYVDGLLCSALAVGCVVLYGHAHGLVSLVCPTYHYAVGVACAVHTVRAAGGVAAAVDIPGVGISSQRLYAYLYAVVGKRRRSTDIFRSREHRYYSVVHQYRDGLLFGVAGG